MKSANARIVDPDLVEKQGPQPCLYAKLVYLKHLAFLTILNFNTLQSNLSVLEINICILHTHFCL